MIENTASAVKIEDRSMKNETVIIRAIDPVAAAAELSARAEGINELIQSLDQTKVVTQETLQIEFSV